MTREWAAIFATEFSGRPSGVAEEIWSAVMGDEFPSGLDTYSYVSKTELATFCEAVAVGPSDTLVDLGCGRGGPGIFVAQHTGASLVGMDITDAAHVEAQERASSRGVDARFVVGSFEDTGLPDESVDAIMSVDALLFTPNKSRAFAEMARILRPSGRLVFTSWDYSGQPAGRPPQVADHRPLAEAAGFHVDGYDPTTDWQRILRETTAGLLARVEELAAEDGAPVEEVRTGLEELAAALPLITRRVMFRGTRAA